MPREPRKARHSTGKPLDIAPLVSAISPLYPAKRETMHWEPPPKTRRPASSRAAAGPILFLVMGDTTQLSAGGGDGENFRSNWAEIAWGGWAGWSLAA